MNKITISGDLLSSKQITAIHFMQSLLSGHFDTVFFLNRPLEEPKMISALSGKQAGKHVIHIACGSTYSAAITAEGELYTWGRGNYGRLGHGMFL